MCNHRYIKYTRHIIYYISTFRSSFTLCLFVCLPVCLLLLYTNTHSRTHTHWVRVYYYYSWSIFHHSTGISFTFFLILFRPFIHSVNQYHSTPHSHSCIHSLTHSFTFLPVYCYYSSYNLCLSLSLCLSISVLTFYQFSRFRYQFGSVFLFYYFVGYLFVSVQRVLSFILFDISLSLCIKLYAYFPFNDETTAKHIAWLAIG